MSPPPVTSGRLFEMRSGASSHGLSIDSAEPACSNAPFLRSGRGAAWLAYLNGVQGVPGSNPGVPTIRLRLANALAGYGAINLE